MGRLGCSGQGWVRAEWRVGVAADVEWNCQTEPCWGRANVFSRVGFSRTWSGAHSRACSFLSDQPSQVSFLAWGGDRPSWVHRKLELLGRLEVPTSAGRAVVKGHDHQLALPMACHLVPLHESPAPSRHRVSTCFTG